jgi:hypothetical protein
MIRASWLRLGLLLAYYVSVFCASASYDGKLQTLKKFVEKRKPIQKVQRSRSAVLNVDGQESMPDDSQSSTLYWDIGDWSDCNQECGPGFRERTVTCMYSSSTLVQDDSVCLNDPKLKEKGKPESVQDCEGECLTCSGQVDLFASIGLSPPPAKPVPSSKNGRVCRVTSSSSCCDSVVDNSIVTQVIAIHKGFQAIPDEAAKQASDTLEYINNSTLDFTARLEDTKNRLDSVEAVLNEQGNLKVDKKINRALVIVRDVLKQRISDLESAISYSTSIVTSIQGQLGVLINDDSMDNSTAIEGYDSGDSRGRRSQLSDCVDATTDLFASMACASCNPAFMRESVETHLDLFKSVNVTSIMCTSLYKECSPTIKDSRRFLRTALQTMKSIHQKLAEAAARLQPAIMTLWTSITFDWLPGSALPLVFQHRDDVQNYVPDVTTLDCIQRTDTYLLPPSTNQDDFCSNFYSSWNYQFTIQNIVKDIKVGVTAMTALQKCDRCFHLIISKIGEILSEGKGGLDVTLALSPRAISEAGCSGLSSVPRKTAMESIKDQLLDGSLSFFATGYDGVWTAGERDIMQRKSKRAIALIMKKDSTTVADQTQLALQSPVVYINKFSFQHDGVDPSTYSNITWDVVRNAAKNPPPTVWGVRAVSEIGIIATDINCTSHVSCNPESGDAPYWFCANEKVCSGSIPCDDNELVLLKAHPKCVKGLCVDGSTAVDGKCPDIAVCPVTKIGQFDHAYFAKYKNTAPLPPPSGELVESEGASNADAITQALNYATGVCDCAFARKIDERGVATYPVGDKCKYAQCVAYALANEEQKTCQGDLKKMCLAIKGDCPDVICDQNEALWNVPSCGAASGSGTQFAMSSDVMSGSSSVMLAGLAYSLVAVLLLV